MKSILDKSFRYVPSHATNVKETWERVRREQEQKAKVKQLFPRKTNER